MKLKKRRRIFNVSFVARDHDLRLPQLKRMSECLRTQVTWTSLTGVVMQQNGGTAPRSSLALARTH